MFIPNFLMVEKWRSTLSRSPVSEFWISMKWCIHFNTSIHLSTLQSTTQFDQPYFSRRHNWCEGARGTAHVWGEGGVWVEGGQESCSQASEGRKCYRSLIQKTLCQAKQVSMIAGGTGITPMLQLVSLAENIKKGKKRRRGSWKLKMLPWYPRTFSKA